MKQMAFAHVYEATTPGDRHAMRCKDHGAETVLEEITAAAAAVVLILLMPVVLQHYAWSVQRMPWPSPGVDWCG